MTRERMTEIASKFGLEIDNSRTEELPDLVSFMRPEGAARCNMTLQALGDAEMTDETMRSWCEMAAKSLA